MLAVKDLSISYDGRTNVVENVSFQIEKPSIVGILGPNGAGKSTLIKGILRLIPSSGETYYNGTMLKNVQRKVAYVEQKSAIDYTFPITVRECVSLGLYPSGKLFKRITAQDWKRVEDALKKVHMHEYQNKQIGALSGGQFQRVLIARTLVQEADLVFLDEPFVGIDTVSEKIIMDLLVEFRNQGKTILIVHHDLGKVKEYFDQLILMNKQLIAYGDTKKVFVEDNLIKTYGDSIVVKGGEG
ncbi:metal ABC transporter ATP-binding protein [Ornithinibacillus massiliensis]|uniref:Metal ABC transporter ATP-binding protein n=1 Tax=Ornithinibacillus massiliensis TaxID=1944633 RepID=A0ABS5M9I3_9BACI|nr:metal ABC transporter ATP-binding protein [Ornithinibacillus massiliensis]MBS3678968.1 metal ABC transporter ATP-binding protein [Ornithinibacillus massiliensis]